MTFDRFDMCLCLYLCLGLRGGGILFSCSTVLSIFLCLFLFLLALALGLALALALALALGLGLCCDRRGRRNR